MIGFFKEKAGVKSFTRLASFIIILSAVGIALFQIAKGQPVNATLIIGMLTVAVGGKVAQKFAEKK